MLTHVPLQESDCSVTSSQFVDPDEGGQVKLEQAVLKYLVARHVQLSPDTRKGYRLVLSSFRDVIGRDFPVARLSQRHVEKWMSSQTCAPASLAGYYSKIRHFTKWLVTHRYLKSDPCALVNSPPRPRSLPRELEAPDVTKLLLNCPDTRGELIVLLMAMEGLRCIEVATREICDVDFSDQMLFVKGKGGHERYLPISDDTMATMRRYLVEHPAGAGPLIRSYVSPTKPLGRKYISIMVAGWMREAGLKEFPYDGKSGHALRHTMAGAMLDSGADIRDVSAALGHSSIAPTVIYTKRRVAATRLREVMGQKSYRV